MKRLSSRHILAVTVLILGLLGPSACVEQGGIESQPVDTREAPRAAKPDKSDAQDPPPPRAFEEDWQRFARDATKHYGFSPPLAAKAGGILEHCLSHAAKLRERSAAVVQSTEAAGNSAMAEKARSELDVGLRKLNDQLLGRIDALASIVQIQAAAAAGFKSPERLDPTPKPEVGHKAPDFALKTPQGQTVSLDSLRGKVAVLQFWAPWCGFCKKAMPEIQKLHETLKDDPRVAIYAIVGRERGKSDPIEVAKAKGCTYDLLLHGAATASLYQVKGYPTLFIVGPDGKIIHKERGAKPKQGTRLVPIIKKALQQKVG